MALIESIANKTGHIVKTALFGISFSAAWAWCGTHVWPWLLREAAARRSGMPLSWPNEPEEILALIGIPLVPLTSFLIYFANKVWKEIERDHEIYKATASRLASFPTVTRDICARWRDALTGFVADIVLRYTFTRRYLRELPRLRKVLDVRNLVMTQANHLDLEDVYIELKAATKSAKHITAICPTTRELRVDRATLWDHLRTLSSGVAIAIVGAPGSGKTTLLKHLMLNYAENRQWRFRVRPRVPFFIELRKLPKVLTKTNADLPNTLAKLLALDRDLAPLLSRMPQAWLAGLLRKGKCLLLCDGLDEVPDPATRQQVSSWLDQQINHMEWRKNLFIITARPAGYESSPLLNAQSLEVQPFDWNDTRAFIRRWYLANRLITSKPRTPVRTIRDLAERDADSLLSKLRDHARLGVLTSNPLLLTMICLMHEMGQLPGSRSQLYKEICEVHLERWRRRSRDGSGGEAPKKETWNSEQKLTVLRPLAYYLMKRGENVNQGEIDSKRLTTSEMLHVTKLPLDHIGVSEDSDSRRTFFLDLHNDSGLWIEWEQDEWGFAHLSFQEYLCADLWFTKPDFVPKEVELMNYLERSWWRECLLLYSSKATDLRPLVRAALNRKTSRSLAFLFALEGETVTIPADLKPKVDEELNLALRSQEIGTFNPAAEAWLLRQQEMGYSRLDEEREISSWVTQAEYQLFLNDRSGNDFFLWPLHQIGKWTVDNPRSPALGMRWGGARTYCAWLNSRFPEYDHRLPLSGRAEEVRHRSNDNCVAWLRNGNLDMPFESQAKSVPIPIGSQFDSLTLLSNENSSRSQLGLSFHFQSLLMSGKDHSDHWRELAVSLSERMGRRLVRSYRKKANKISIEIDAGDAFGLAAGFSFGFFLDLPPEALSLHVSTVAELLSSVAGGLSPWSDRDIRRIVKGIKDGPNRELQVFMLPNFFRRLLIACLQSGNNSRGWLRNRTSGAVELVARDLIGLLQLLVSRESNESTPWEGIRVIRTRNK